MQKVYRTKLPADELEIWAETLKEYSFQEFDRAMKHLIDNPPKYELDDGSIQVWRGMPKLPDVVDVMLGLRERAIQEASRRESERQTREFAELEKRRAEHPEEFMSWGQFCERLKADKPELAAKLGMKMPNAGGLDLDKNAANLEQLKAEAVKVAERFK